MDSALIETPLGIVFALAGKKGLQRLEFAQEGQLAFGDSLILDQIEEELEYYFSGKLKIFKTPLDLQGTSFQKQVWEELRQIPYGQTVSYKAVAEKLGKPGASRAVGTANGLNPVVLVIACHRVIAADGSLGGYSAGLSRKEWLLKHEQSVSSTAGSTFHRAKEALHGFPLQ